MKVRRLRMRIQGGGAGDIKKTPKVPNVAKNNLLMMSVMKSVHKSCIFISIALLADSKQSNWTIIADWGDASIAQILLMTDAV